MPSLKQYRTRIASVKSTQKITSAMKMVAAAKLRRAQEKAEAARPYAERMSRMLGSLAGSLSGGAGARNHVRQLLSEGKQVRIFCVGRKGRDQLRRDFAKLIVGSMEDVGRRSLSFADAQRITDRILQMFAAGEFDVCSLFYARFRSAITQIVTRQQLIPFAIEGGAGPAASAGGAVYEYEPDEEQILAELLPRNLSVQVFRALLENNASEQGARMTAMDNATRNAGDMIKRLTLSYNRQRQASITKELIEIISGAEAV